jgi:peptide/nickel transport system ATP-binding protein
MIAMALAGNPEILIADEPTTALDVPVQKKILELLRKIRLKRDMSMILISHDLGVVRSVCDKALVMYQGKIVESGETRNLFEHPQHPYTMGLLACRPRLSSGHSRLPVMSDFLTPGKTENTENKLINVKTDTSSDCHAADMPETVLLEARDLQTSYSIQKNLLGKTLNSIRAVDHISFYIMHGETLGLIGESGCGKSTLGRSIVSLIRSRKGEILFHGETVTGWKGKRLNEFRRNVQFIFQDPFSSLNPSIPVGRALTEVMRVHGLHGGKYQRERAAMELLGKVGLSSEHFHHYAHEFSGGQRQRIGIARALATNPKLVICDESVSSLDVSVQAQILNLLNDLKEDFGLTYLFISHDLAVVKYMSDRIMVMKDGKLLEISAADDLFRNPRTDYSRELINSVLD